MLGPLEADLLQQVVMTDDSLSNYEYECMSPDDISLPPLSETLESNLVQSDVKESVFTLTLKSCAGQIVFLWLIFTIFRNLTGQQK